MPKPKKKEAKELKIYKGGYFVAGKNKTKAEATVENISDNEDRVVLLHPGKEVSVATVRRSVSSDRRALRITPKRPKLRR